MKIPTGSNLIILFLLIVAFFSGFINLIVDVGINLSTITIDISLLILSLLFLTSKRKGKIIKKQYPIFIFILFVLIKSLFDGNDLTERILGLRNWLLYLSPVLILPIFITRIKFFTRFFRVFYILGGVLLSFAILQGVLNYNLPQYLLSPKSDGIATLYDKENLIRVNGLIGNAINFTGIGVLLFNFYLVTYFLKKRKKDLLLIFLSLFALYLTHSRIAYVGILSIFMVLLVFSNRRFKQDVFSIMGYFLVIITIGLTLGYSWLLPKLEIIKETPIYERFFEEEATTKGSNAKHLSDTYNAIQAVKDYPILGVGIGTQGESARGQRIISDGSWFHLFLELGSVLAVLHFYLIYQVFILSKNNLKRDDISIDIKIISGTLVGFTFFLLISGFVNSIYIARIIYMIYWMLAGVLFSNYRLELFR